MIKKKKNLSDQMSEIKTGNSLAGLGHF